MSLNNMQEIDFDLTQISIVARKVQVELDRALKPLELNASNYYFLLKIDPVTGTTQDQLYRQIYLDQSNITRRLLRLEQLGLITKSRSADDGRVWKVDLTPTGRERIGPLKAAIEDVNHTIFANLATGQQEQLMQLLTTVGTNLI
ncbi:transcriptional regulator [Furfurilactobacillus siliginis]|uniref:Transcriptional regulator n=2 Tax=Furfurilactobacillus siliginis TaxID=348151 RepID=A0A510VRF9_9LACO|nr:transcriptional regulator [Furfurilactobacillus siliginis]